MNGERRHPWVKAPGDLVAQREHLCDGSVTLVAGGGLSVLNPGRAGVRAGTGTP
jgi:hypothetical protein